MFGKMFRCANCEHSFNAGMTGLYESETEPKLLIFVTGDVRGHWVKEAEQKEAYCGVCSKDKFPVMNESDFNAKRTGAAMF